MSLSLSQHREQWYSCDYVECNRERDPDDAVKGGYCSEECFWRHRGWKILKTIRTDHSWCSTCFRPLKEVEEVPDETRNGLGEQTAKAVVGFQYPTPRVQWVTGDARPPDWVTDHLATRSPGAPTEHQTWGCVCGSTNPADEIDEIREGDLANTIQSLWACLHDLHDRDKTNSPPSQGPFLDVLREELDWNRAAARAIYSD